ncbi:hypothetical protein [Granulosicoccus antarcticus]|uniref:Asp/Glu racemase n=1 Tax=Granulosicoccus antarcticus IMCC3135 TaxID=1192854 RepID=A0A2Z2P2P2_9GAMM|nr:hypothetical protein [Granulosicoccus antarcticus]ASJ74837.1 hypothetical protein IMCC3135_23840 [Granulosicoccus antarcticus IMCC3135]
MQSFEFDLEEDHPDEPAVGLIVLQTDETLEHELRLGLPDKIRLFHSRIPNSVDISTDSLLAMKAAMPTTLALLPSTTAFRVIVYGCTSAATVIGEQAVTETVRSVFPQVAVTNPLSAIKARLTSLQAMEALIADTSVDAIVASCTNLRMSGMPSDASARLGVPVISSNSALIWHIQTLLDACHKTD